ncbi:MAG TPA: cupredoxin domain-containing protein [Candidatus Acidoferrales bacterium]|uniref:Cytochrome C oxidase subunit II, cytochrome c oxidase subunit II n=1 Tax=uncultured Acidobacteria bacterium Rifle_16ft_4_minimus_37967 TaxID=1665087 RepID=A0A0H4TRJ8_9BACT|nr:cytochrome C oxidase subunit II, cytochrome c oxidase subunit II [uncultured Acidobacteria bacterium Rifle_16ft_4_minimus_37967]
MKKPFLTIVSALLAVFLVPVPAWMHSQREEPPPDRRIAIIAERFSYIPSRIKLKRGATVEFVLTSEDTYHGFYIRRLGVNVMIPAQGKGEKKVRIHFAEAGQYVFECSRACGAGHNAMRGLIIVE